MDINFIDINKPQTDDEEEEEEDPNRADPLAVDPLELDPIKMEPEDEAVLKTEEVHFDDVHPDFIIKTENFEDDEDCQNKEGVEAGDPTFVEDPLAINPPDENQVQTQPQPKPLQIMFVPVMMNNNVGGQVVTPVGQVVTPSGQNQQKLLVTTGGSIANSPNVNVPITGYQPSLRESRIRKVRDPTIDTTINYPCGICKKTFYIEEAVIKHREEKHATQMNKLERNKCYLCGKVFDKLNLLVLHIKEHMLEKECKVCNLVFETPELFKAHALATHMKYNYKCSVCLKTFEKESGLRCHMTVMHSAATSSSEANAFICKICGKGFMSEDLLNLHDLNIHKTSTVLSTSGQGPVTPSAVPNAITSVQGAIMPNVITSVQGAVVPTILPNLQGIVAPNIQGNVISTGPEANKISQVGLRVSLTNAEIQPVEISNVIQKIEGKGKNVLWLVLNHVNHSPIHDPKTKSLNLIPGKEASVQPSPISVDCKGKMDKSLVPCDNLSGDLVVNTNSENENCEKSVDLKISDIKGDTETDLCISDISCTKDSLLSPDKVISTGTETTLHDNQTSVSGVVDDNILHGWPKYSCEICSRTYSSMNFLNKHVLRHSSKRDHVCDVCGKAFYEQLTLLKHKDNLHSGKATVKMDKHYKCNICEKKYAMQSSLTAHMATHTSQNGNYKCEFCEKVFVSVSGRRVHTMYKHKFNEDFKCDKCSMSYKTQKRLKWHLARHDVKFQCDKCDKSFFHRHELQSHLNRYHTKEFIFKCPECDKSYPSKSHLTSHMYMHMEKKYECNMCDTKFVRRSHFNSHLASHSNLRDHQCEVCGKCFKKNATLRIHKLIHSSIKRFVCELCNQAFTQPSALFNHKKLKHKKKTSKVKSK